MTRNVVERTINKPDQTRAVATRYDKREFLYRGTTDVAPIRIWLPDPPETYSRGPAWLRARCLRRPLPGSGCAEAAGTSSLVQR